MDAKEIAHRVDIVTTRNRLKWNEDEIMKATRSIAGRMKEIHDHKLWEHDYASFEEYCSRKWGMSRQRAYQIIGAEGARLALVDATDDPELKQAAAALNNLQAAEIVKVPESKRIKVLKKAVHSPGKMTTAKIKRIAVTVVPSLADVNPLEDDAPKICPKCKQTIC